jgi:hypothetical protein
MSIKEQFICSDGKVFTDRDKAKEYDDKLIYKSQLFKYIENNIVEASEEDASIKYDIFDFIITNNRTELIKLIQEYPY